MPGISTLAGIAVLGALGVIALAYATRFAPVQRIDDLVEERVGPHRLYWRFVAGAATLTGERLVHPAIAALTAFALIHYRGGAPKRFLLPLGAASLGGILFHHAVKFFYHRPRPQVALDRDKTEGAYPSGHTTNATSVVLTSMNLLVHEQLLDIRLAVLCAASLCIATGVSRVMLGWHWTTDVLGGFMAGACVSSLATLLYLSLR